MRHDGSLCFNVHSLVRIRALDLTDKLRANLIAQLGTFLTEEELGKTADIILCQLDREATRPLKLFQLKDFTKFCVNLYQDELVVVYGYRAEIDIVVNVSDPVYIFYTPRRGCWDNLLNALLLSIQLVLVRKGGMVCHGAVAALEDRCVVLTGPGGTGKSIFLLNMLNDGWGYLSDDLFILYQTRAYMFRRYIGLNAYHFQRLPWLKQLIPEGEKVRRWEGARECLRLFAERVLPAPFAPRLKKFYHPSFAKELDDLFPGRETLTTAQPKIWIEMAPDVDFGLARVSETEILDGITAIQCLGFPDFVRLGQMASLFGYGRPFDIKRLIGLNLRGHSFFRMRVPYQGDIAGIYPTFKQCLDRAL